MALVRTKATKSMTWWVGVGLCLISAATLIESRRYGVAGMMPGVASAAILGLTLLHTVGGLLFGVVANDDEWHSAEERLAYARRRWGYIAVGLALCIGIWAVGFHIALPVFLVLFVGTTTGRWVLAALLSASMAAFTWGILHGVLHVSFPASLLQRWMIAQGIY